MYGSLIFLNSTMIQLQTNTNMTSNLTEENVSSASCPNPMAAILPFG